MAGHPFEDAVKADLDAILLAASPAIDWRRKDVASTGEQPGPPAADADDALAGWFEIEFIGGDESQFTSGSPGNNLHREVGQITLRAVTRLQAGETVRDLAGAYMAQLASSYRARRIALDATRRIRVVGLMPMGEGQDEAGDWVRSLGIRYELFNVG